MAKNKPLDPQTAADVDYLGMIFAKGISGLMTIGLSDGMKMKAALDRVTKSKAGQEVLASLWSKYWNIDPNAIAVIDMVAAMNPSFKACLERWNMKAKDATPDDDVKTAERI